MPLYPFAPRALTALPEARRNEIAKGGLTEKELHMTRTVTFRIWILALVVTALAAPSAIAAEQQSSLNAIVGGKAQQSEPSEQQSSLNAIVGGKAQQSEPSSGPSGHPSVNALAGSDESPATPAPSLSSRSGNDGFPSVNAVAGGEPSPTPVVEVRRSSGFEWGDALIGAGVTLTLLLIGFGATRLSGQYRQRTAESSA
jgi:hypothetical protein